jgi:hypothetical protein
MDDAITSKSSDVSSSSSGLLVSYSAIVMVVVVVVEALSQGNQQNCRENDGDYQRREGRK